MGDIVFVNSDGKKRLVSSEDILQMLAESEDDETSDSSSDGHLEPAEPQPGPSRAPDAVVSKSKFRRKVSVVVSEESSSEGDDGEENIVEVMQEGTRKRVFLWSHDKPSTKKHKFSTSNVGVQLPFTKDTSVLDYFLHFFSLDFVEKICQEINNFYRLKTSTGGKLSHRLSRWKDITPDKFYCFLGISMLMSRNSRLEIQECWSKDVLLHSPIFGMVMSRNDYQLILRLLHFCNNDDKSKDPLVKIRLVVDHMKKKFSETLAPTENLCIDESLLLFKGRLYFKQYIPKKRSRFGIKIFVLCDCETGFILDFIIYTGASTDCTESHPNLGKSGDVVASLLHPYLEKGHTIFLDNWYSSPELFGWLYDKTTNAVGTVRRNRKNMPCMMEKLKKGELTFRSCDNFLVLRWCDRRDVWMLSTYHTPDMKYSGKVDYATGEQKMKPEVVLDYNKSMGAVDRSDMILSSVESVRKSVKWYKKFFFHTLDMVMLNSKILYCKIQGKNIPVATFHLELIRQLFEKFHVSTPRRSGGRRSSNEDIPTRLKFPEAHYPKCIPSTEKKKNPLRACVVCKSHSKRRESRYMCSVCNVALCVDPCFGNYHSKKSY